MDNKAPDNGEFSFASNTPRSTGRKGLPKIQTQDHNNKANDVCHDDSGTPVKAKTIDELHSLQRKKSAPTTPIKGAQGAFNAISEEERQKQQLQSIRWSDYSSQKLITIWLLCGQFFMISFLCCCFLQCFLGIADERDRAKVSERGPGKEGRGATNCTSSSLYAHHQRYWQFSQVYPLPPQSFSCWYN